MWISDILCVVFYTSEAPTSYRDEQKIIVVSGETLFFITSNVVYIVSYGILCHYGNFFSDTFYEYVLQMLSPNLLSVHPYANY